MIAKLNHLMLMVLFFFKNFLFYLLRKIDKPLNMLKQKRTQVKGAKIKVMRVNSQR